MYYFIPLSLMFIVAIFYLVASYLDSKIFKRIMLVFFIILTVIFVILYILNNNLIV